MDEADKKKITDNLVYLVNGLTVDEAFVANLQSERTITNSMAEEILAKIPMSTRVSHFASLIQRRGPFAFGVFMKTCVVTGQAWIAETLDPDLARKYAGLSQQVQVSRAPQHPVGGGTHPGAWGDRPAVGPAPPFHDLHPKPNRSADNIQPDDVNGTFIKLNILEVNPMDPRIQSLINDTKGVYKMSSDPRGKCIIINNESFTRMSAREGSPFDAVNVSELFRKLNFDSEIWTDYTAKDIVQKIDAERQNPFLREYDCFAMVIMSHGNRGVIYGIDTEKVSIEDEIVSAFDSLRCPALAGKPKLFFIQACQGNLVTLGIPQSDDGAEENGATAPEPKQPDKPDAKVEEIEKQMEEVKLTDEMKQTDDADSVPILPSTHEKADMLLAYSTVPGYKSWRHPQLGSWFVRELVHVINHLAHEEHLADMLTYVSRRVSERQVIFKGFVQISEIRSTLRKKLYFLPGYKQKC